MLTGLLGAGVALDAFVVMMKIPSVFRRLFAEGAFNQAFIPVLAEYKENNSIKETKDLINFTFGALASTLLCVTILALLATPIFVMIFAPGFYLEPLKKELATDILQITFPYLFFISLVALSGSILNSLSEARRALKENSVYVNKSRVDDNKILNVNDLIIEGVILVQRGKKKYLILDFTD